VSRRPGVAAAVAKPAKWVFLLFMLAVAVFPLLWLLLNSLRTNLELQIS